MIEHDDSSDVCESAGLGEGPGREGTFETVAERFVVTVRAGMTGTGC